MINQITCCNKLFAKVSQIAIFITIAATAIMQQLKQRKVNGCQKYYIHAFLDQESASALPA